MKVILFGASGFIGTHFREKAFYKGGIEVIAVSNRPPTQSRFPGQTAIALHEFLRPQFEARIASADSVVYLGSASIPSTFAAEPWREVAENVEPTFKLLNRIVRINPKIKLVFASSGGTVYGRSCGHKPVVESAELAPISAYGLGKVFIEQALGFLGRTEGVPFAILRIGNPIGIHAQSHAQGLVGAILRHAIADRPMTVFGDGSNIRDYLSANDVADAILLAASDTRFSDAIWNVGSGIGHSVSEMINLVARQIDRPIIVKHQPKRETDVDCIILDSMKIKSDLGWQTQTPIHSEILTMWQRLSNDSPRTTII